MSHPAETDAALARRLATEAGEMLVALRADLFGRRLPPWEVMDAILEKALKPKKPQSA